jgi:uncharacterized protein YndB with AHSA1/START domain
MLRTVNLACVNVSHLEPTQVSSNPRELLLVRETDVPAEKLYAGWTTAELYPKWFCPQPWTVADVELDVRTGGSSRMTMCGPDGERFPNVGIYLEVIPNQKLVFTDGYLPGWEPNPELFFTAIVTFETLSTGGTRYTARVRHWTIESCEKHAAMGFHAGWNKAFDQLVDAVRNLP